MKLTKPFILKKIFRTLQRSCSTLASAKTEIQDQSLTLTLLDLSPLSGQHISSSDRPFLRCSDKTGTRNKAPFTPEHVEGQKVVRQLKLTLQLLLKSSGPWKILLCPSPRVQPMLGRTNLSVGRTWQFRPASFYSHE